MEKIIAKDILFVGLSLLLLFLPVNLLFWGESMDFRGDGVLEIYEKHK